MYEDTLYTSVATKDIGEAVRLNRKGPHCYRK